MSKKIRYYYLSRHKNITIDIILDNPEDRNNLHKWYYNAVLQNPNLTWEWIERNPRGILNQPWNYKNLSKNSIVNWNIVSKNKDLNWSYFLLGSNPSIYWEDIVYNPAYGWDFYMVSKNKYYLWHMVNLLSNDMVYYDTVPDLYILK